MATKPLILLTGATGFVGFRTLILALEAGFSVRCAIRDPKKESAIISNQAIESLRLASGTLTFVVVPDLTASGAYKPAIQDVTYVIHIASPLPRANPSGFKTSDETFIKPAVHGALEILKAAQLAGTVRRVVITSSVAAMIPGPIWGSLEPSDGIEYGPESRMPTPKGHFPDNAQAYGASKTAQLNAVEDWRKKQNPDFGIITIHPSWILGRNELALSVGELWAGTNRFPLDIAIGKRFQVPKTGASVHVDDVARAHILVLDEELEGNRSLVLSSSMNWEDVPRILRDHFPKEVERGILSLEGSQPTATIDVRGDETEKVLGFQYLDFEEQVKGLIAQYLALKRKYLIT